MDTIKIANLLVRLRKEHNLTQNDLAMELGVSYQAVSKWERGENLPDSGLLLSLANYYGITVDEILNGEMNDEYMSYSNKKVDKSNNDAVYISLGTAFFILSPVPYLLLERYSEVFATLTLLLFIVFGITTFIVYGFKADKRDKKIVSSKNERKSELVWGICTFVFLFVGFVFGIWHPTWLIFVLAGVLTNYFIK